MSIKTEVLIITLLNVACCTGEPVAPINWFKLPLKAGAKVAEFRPGPDGLYFRTVRSNEQRFIAIDLGGENLRELAIWAGSIQAFAPLGRGRLLVLSRDLYTVEADGRRTLREAIPYTAITFTPDGDQPAILMEDGKLFARGSVKALGDVAPNAQLVRFGSMLAVFNPARGAGAILWDGRESSANVELILPSGVRRELGARGKEGVRQPMYLRAVGSDGTQACAVFVTPQVVEGAEVMCFEAAGERTYRLRLELGRGVQMTPAYLGVAGRQIILADEAGVVAVYEP